jgi:hypothetical protein
VGIARQWLLAPMWHLHVVYPSTILKIIEFCVDGDDTHVGIGQVVVATKWNLHHPIQGD